MRHASLEAIVKEESTSHRQIARLRPIFGVTMSGDQGGFRNEVTKELILQTWSLRAD